MKTKQNTEIKTSISERVYGAPKAPLLWRSWERLFLLFFIIGLSTANAQFGIGTITPDASSVLDVTATDKGFLPPRMSTAQRDAISSPADGLIIYNLTVHCLEVYKATTSTWINLCDGIIDSINCGSPTNTGTLTANSAASGVSSTVSYTGGNGKPYDAVSEQSTGVTGLTLILPPGSFNSGSGGLTFDIYGTPTSSGTATFSFTIGGQSCSITRIVDQPASIPINNLIYPFLLLGLLLGFRKLKSLKEVA